MDRLSRSFCDSAQDEKVTPYTTESSVIAAAMTTSSDMNTEKDCQVGNVDAENSSQVAPSKVEPVLKLDKIKKFNKKTQNRGVIYLSRVPPFMKPDQVKNLLGKYGDINRIYLVPEDEKLRTRRMKSGGNRRVRYTEGWIEFEDKTIAKNVAKCLNLKKVGSKKRDRYHDDMWCLKYLKGFQWSHLTEKIAYENRVRQQKLRMEVAQASRENALYLDRVEQAKTFEKMEERKRGTAKAKPATDASADSSALDNIRRKFRQNKPVAAKEVTANEKKKVLEQIFGEPAKKKAKKN